MHFRMILFAVLLLSARTGVASDKIPQKLGDLVMGMAPPCEYLVGQCDGAEKVWYVTDKALTKMWLSLAPEMQGVVHGATITSYQQRVVQIIFSLSPGVKFEDVHRNFINRFGEGKKTDVRTPSDSKSEDCPQMYLVQNWSDGSGELTVIGEPHDSVHVILRNNLARDMDKDPEYVPEDEPCLAP